MAQLNLSQLIEELEYLVSENPHYVFQLIQEIEYIMGTELRLAQTVVEVEYEYVTPGNETYVSQLLTEIEYLVGTELSQQYVFGPAIQQI